MDNLKKALKEGLRVVILAVLPIVMESINIQAGTIIINWSIVQTVAILAVLRMVDKYYHEAGNENKAPIQERTPSGILPF